MFFITLYIRKKNPQESSLVLSSHHNEVTSQLSDLGTEHEIDIWVDEGFMIHEKL